MSEPEKGSHRQRLRELLRVGRFEGWTLDMLEDEIEKLYGRGVDIQPPVAPDQQPEPPVA
jgi:hypothetical protein